MSNFDYANRLRERAEKFIAKNPNNRQTLSYEDVYKLIDELHIYEISVKLQQEDLNNVLLEVEALRNRYADLYNFLPFGFFALNQHGIILEANEAGANLIGVTRDNLINHPLNRYIAPDVHHIFNEHHTEVLKSDCLQSCEIKLLRRDGPIFPAQMDSKSVNNLITGEKCLLTFITDITNRKNKENSIHLQQQKAASIDRNISIEKLASIMAHELNHPLAVNANYLHGCIHRLESGNYQVSDILTALKKAAEQSHRAAEIILRIKNFTCKGTLNFELVNLNELIQETISLIHYETIDYPTQINYTPIKSLPQVMIDKIHIQQVILNLTRNAIEAMRDTNASDPKISIETNPINKHTIEVCVIDNGPGIKEDAIYKLFNPYFTTKPYGVGLGLAISNTIVEAHGQKLLVEPNPIGGACFKFNLSTKLLETTLKNSSHPEISHVNG